MSEVSFSESIDRLKESFLWAAAQGGNSQDCESLIEIGADVNWKNADGDTPLLAACRRGHTETIALLLAHGADANVCGSDSFTPLHVSTRRGDADSVNALLNANTSTAARTKEGQTALDIARAKGYESIYARLMEKRSGIARPQPGAEATSTLINNVRNELPSLLHTRPDSAGNNGSIAPASRKLQSLGRLIHQETVGDSDRDKNAANSLGSASRRRRNEKQNMTSASIDGVPTGAWAGADTSTDSISSRSLNSNFASSERNQKISNSGMASNATTGPKSSESDAKATASTHSANASSKASTPSNQASQASAAAPAVVKAASYSIIGSAGAGSQQAMMSGDETATIALRKILDQEKAARKQLEMKLAVFKDQNTQLLQEFASLSQQLSESQDESNQLEQQVSRLLGHPAALESATIEECDELEKALKTSLERVEAKKAVLIRNKIDNQMEQRMCVVCQEAEKSVVLLPCRHLCLCAACSTHDLLTMCPLCREKIVHKISVFS